MTLNFLEGGGHFWVYLQYVRGLRQAGCEVYWLECLPPGPVPDTSKVQVWLDRLQRYGLGGKVILCTTADGHSDRRYLTMTGDAARDVLTGADLLLNFHYGMDAELVTGSHRSAMVDIDPGLLQMWMITGQVSPAPHDVYL